MTEDIVLRARDKGGRSEEGDDVGVWRGVEEEGTAEERVHEGDTGGKRNGLGHIEALGLELREEVRNRSAWRMLTMTVAIGVNESTAKGDKVSNIISSSLVATKRRNGARKYGGREGPSSFIV